MRLVPGGDYSSFVKDGYYRDCLMKLQVLNITEYDRIIFMDSDAILLRSIEHLFFLPDVPLAAPWCYWDMNTAYFTSLLLVVRPSEDLFLRTLKRFGQNDKKWLDMDILNVEFSVRLENNPGCRQFSEINVLPSLYGILIGEFAPDWTGTFWPWHEPKSKLFEETGYIVHFSGKKPWQSISINNPSFPYFKKVYDLWQNIADKVCKFSSNNDLPKVNFNQ